MLKFPNVIMHAVQHDEEYITSILNPALIASTSRQYCAMIPSPACSVEIVMLSKTSTSFGNYWMFQCRMSYPPIFFS